MSNIKFILFIPILFIVLFFSCTTKNEEKKLDESQVSEDLSDSGQDEAETPEPGFYDTLKLGKVQIIPASETDFNNNSEPTILKSMCPGEVTDECYKKFEKYLLAKDSALVKSNESGIQLQADNGETIHLVNKNTDDDSFINYKYEGQLGSCGFYVIWVGLYEGGNYLLVSKKTGEKFEIWGEPKVTKDCKKVLSYSYDVEAGFLANGIQIFNIVNDKLELYWEKDFEEWGPEEVKWVSNNELIIKRKKPAFGNGEDLVAFGKITLN